MRAQFQNQEINIGTMLLTELEILFLFHQFLHFLLFSVWLWHCHLQEIYVCISLVTQVTKMYFFVVQSLSCVQPLRPQGLQHARLPSLALSPEVYSSSCPLSQWCHPTISSPVVVLLLLSSISPSIGVFPNESALGIRWPKYWSFSIIPSNEYSGLISFRIDWFDLLAIQGALKSLLQHHNLKASVPWHSAFFMVQLSHLYMTPGKTIALTRQTFVTKWCFCFLIHCLGLS